MFLIYHKTMEQQRHKMAAAVAGLLRWSVPNSGKNKNEILCKTSFFQPSINKRQIVKRRYTWIKSHDILHERHPCFSFKQSLKNIGEMMTSSALLTFFKGWESEFGWGNLYMFLISIAYMDLSGPLAYWYTGPRGTRGTPQGNDLKMLDKNHYRYKHIFEYTNLTIYMTIYINNYSFLFIYIYTAMYI